ncbi:MAG: fimbrillin family protein [Prevotella sp.]|nr:fimbrillin family protein [Prevotella sp.]
MKTSKTIAIAMLAATLAACSSDDNNGTKVPKYINIDAKLSPVTKTIVTSDGVMNFASGDAISVYAWTGSSTALPATADAFVVNGSTNTYDGTKWTASPQMLWKNVTSPHFFLAVYPARDILKDKTYTFDVADQDKSDLMVATNFGTNATGIVATETAIPLAFDHMMAKLQVNLQFRNQWGENGPSSVSAYVNTNTTADIDFLAKTVTATGTTSDIILPSVTATVDGYAKSFESILLPVTDLKSIKIVIDGQNYTYTHDNNIQLQSGKTTIVNLVVGRNEINLGSMSIKGWETLLVIGDNDNPIEVTE